MTNTTADALRRLTQIDAELGIDGDIHIDQAAMFVREARQAVASIDAGSDALVKPERPARTVAESARAFLDFAFGEPGDGCR